MTVELFLWSQMKSCYSQLEHSVWTWTVLKGNVATTSFLSILLGLPGRPNGCVLRRGRRPPLPLFVFSPRRLCALHHAVYNFPILDTNRQQVSPIATLLAHYALPRDALTRLLCLSARVAQRQRVRRHRRGGSVQPRGEADILPLQKV